MARLTRFALAILLAVMTSGVALAEWSGATKPGTANTAAVTGNAAAGKRSSLTGLGGTKSAPLSQHQEKPKPTVQKIK